MQRRGYVKTCALGDASPVEVRRAESVEPLAILDDYYDVYVTAR